MLTKKIGKILSVRFGMGGYQDAQFGISFTLGGDHWSVSDFVGVWAGELPNNAHWTEKERMRTLGAMCLNIANQLLVCKKMDVYELINTPVEVTFDSNERLFKWRILKEAL